MPQKDLYIYENTVISPDGVVRADKEALYLAETLAPSQAVTFDFSAFKNPSLKISGLGGSFAKFAGRDIYSDEFVTPADAAKNKPEAVERLVAKERKDSSWDILRIVKSEDGDNTRKLFFYHEARGVSKSEAIETIASFNQSRGNLMPVKFMGQTLARRYPGMK